jgi:hypothetical protein
MRFRAGEGRIIRGVNGSSSSVSSSSTIALLLAPDEVPRILCLLGLSPKKPEIALGDAPRAASYEGMGAMAIWDVYPGGWTSLPAGMAIGEVRSSGMGAGRLGPASSGPGRLSEAVLPLTLEFPLAPDSELDRRFLKMFRMVGKWEGPRLVCCLLH